MAKRKNSGVGCCGCFLRILLALLNLFILIVGIALVVVTCLYKWSNVFDFIKNYKGLDQLVNFETINGIVITLLVIGCYLIVLSMVGFIAVVSMNQAFLGIYEVLLLIIFLAHLGALIALLVLQPKYEEVVRAEFDDIIDRINNASKFGISTSELDAVYTSLYAISGTFSCCGKRFVLLFENTRFSVKFLKYFWNRYKRSKWLWCQY